jgi:AraC family transcriptional regulator
MLLDSKKPFLREEYTARVNRVIDYIEHNIDGSLSLQDLAKIANFSPFHFHRIFRAMIGETITNFIQRIRIEKAAIKLIHNPKKSVTEIAFECGFTSSSAFARAFREAFDCNASKWRSESQSRCSNVGKKESKTNQAIDNTEQDFKVISSYNQGTVQQIWRVTMESKQIQAKVEVNEIPEMHLAYIRHIGAYAGNEELFGNLFDRLCRWAGPRGLLRFPETKFVTIYHDNPDITEDAKLRTDVCLTVLSETQVDGEIGKTTIPAGRYAVGHFEIMPDQYGDAWNTLYGGWLPESGYQPDDRPCFEMYLNNPKEDPEGKHIVDIYMPVKPL